MPCTVDEDEIFYWVVSPSRYDISNDIRKYFNTQQHPNKDPNKIFKLQYKIKKHSYISCEDLFTGWDKIKNENMI